VDDEHVLALVEAVHRAHFDAVHGFAANATLDDDVGQLTVLSAGRSGELVELQQVSPPRYTQVLANYRSTDALVDATLTGNLGLGGPGFTISGGRTDETDGLPRAIECGHQDTDGARIKDVIAEEVAHFAPLPRLYCPLFLGLARR